MLPRLARTSYGLALVTLPWVGVGVLRLVTGRDWGWGLQPSWLFLALAILLSVVDRVRRGSLRTGVTDLLGCRAARWWSLGAVAVLAALLISSIGLWSAPSGVAPAEAWARFAKQVIQLAIMAAFVTYPALWTRGPDRWKWTLRMLIVGASIQLGYGALQAVEYYQPFGILSRLEALATSNPSILSGSRDLYLDGKMHEIPRLRGTVCEPLYLGNYLLMVLPLLFLMPRGRGRDLLIGALLALLLGTWSRGAWLGLVGGGMAALVLRASVRRPVVSPAGSPGSRRGILLGAAVMLAVLGCVGWIAGWDVLRLPAERLGQTFSRQDWSNLTRLYSMEAAWRAFLLSPAVGVGWGQFGFHFPALVDPLGLQSQFTWPVVNNFPLLILCETGLAGFLVFGVLLARLGADVRRRLAGASTPFGRTVLIGTGAAFAGVWFQLLTFSQYNLPHIWVVLGLVLAATADRFEGGDGGGV